MYYHELRTDKQQIDLYSVGMEYPEALKAEQYIKGKNKMLEWGGGGSTLYFPSLVENYVSIEHDQEWYEKLKPQLLDNVEFYHVPIHEEKFDDDSHGHFGDGVKTTIKAVGYYLLTTTEV